ncbi:MAG: thiamine phosphate synthase [Pirellulales bacterium]
MQNPPESIPAGDSSHDRWARLRILDANANRAHEGLRVVEEHARFVLEDPFLARQFKQLRHDLAAALADLPLAERLAARDTPGDIGTTITTPSEWVRESVAQVAAANLARVEQSLRCLEEYAKGFLPPLAAAAESLRYRTYPLAQAVARLPHALARLGHARLYVLVDAQRGEADFCEFIEGLVQAGVDLIQLRDKRRDDRSLLEYARLLRRLTRGTPTLFVMNDRPDLAMLADADGVHVGQEELKPADVRRLVGASMLVGVSTHSLVQARQAVLDGADYLGCGPTFPSTTKHFDAFMGLEFLREAAAEIRLPAFAIGGITLGRLPDVRAAGFSRVAVSGAIAAPAAARAFVQALAQP